MKFFEVRELSNNTKKVMSNLIDNKIIITDNKKPIAIMIGIDEDNFEKVLSTMHQIEVNLAISKLQAKLVLNFLNSLIEEEITKARQK